MKLRINYQISNLLLLLNSAFTEHLPCARHVAEYRMPNNRQNMVLTVKELTDSINLFSLVSPKVFLPPTWSLSVQRA